MSVYYDMMELVLLPNLRGAACSRGGRRKNTTLGVKREAAPTVYHSVQSLLPYSSMIVVTKILPFSGRIMWRPDTAAFTMSVIATQLDLLEICCLQAISSSNSGFWRIREAIKNFLPSGSAQASPEQEQGPCACLGCQFSPRSWKNHFQGLTLANPVLLTTLLPHDNIPHNFCPMTSSMANILPVPSIPNAASAPP